MICPTAHRSESQVGPKSCTEPHKPLVLKGGQSGFAGARQIPAGALSPHTHWGGWELFLKLCKVIEQYYAGSSCSPVRHGLPPKEEACGQELLLFCLNCSQDFGGHGEFTPCVSSEGEAKILLQVRSWERTVHLEPDQAPTLGLVSSPTSLFLFSGISEIS